MRQEVVEAQGHLIDSHLMEQIFDTVVEFNARFEVEQFQIGRTNADSSYLRLTYNNFRMNVTLKPELERLIADEVKSGRSADPGEFLDKAVYHYLVARDLGEEYSREEIEEKIARGLAQAERGETVDGEAAFRELRAFAAERRRQRCG